MNTNFDPFSEARTLVNPREDLPTRLTNRCESIFITTIGHEGTQAPNYQALKLVGEVALVTGLVGMVASVYFKSCEYLPQCLGNIAVGAFAIMRGLRES